MGFTAQNRATFRNKWPTLSANWGRKLLACSLIAAMGLVFGCRGERIPNQIRADEYSLYSAWLSNYIQRHQEQLYIARRTANFDVLLTGNCSQAFHDQGKVPWSLIKPLQVLGDAQYLLPADEAQHRLNVPVAYKMTERMPLDSRDSFTYVSFSRVAFNRDHSEALFFFAHTGCQKDPNSSRLECGGGGARALHAVKRSGQWQIQPVAGCVSIE